MTEQVDQAPEENQEPTEVTDQEQTPAPEGQTPQNAPEQEQESPEEGTDTNEDSDQQDQEDTVDWIEHDDESVRGVQDLLKDGGFTAAEADDVFAKALETGDMNDIDMDTLVEKLGANKAAMVKDTVTNFYNKVQAEQQAIIESVYNVFGGEESFNVVREWAQAKEKAEPNSEFSQRLNEFRVMFDQGGFAAEAAAKELFSMYNKDGDTSSPNNTIVHGDNAQPANTESLSRAEYVKEIQKAYNEGNDALAQQLQARRRATMKGE